MLGIPKRDWREREIRREERRKARGEIKPLTLIFYTHTHTHTHMHTHAHTHMHTHAHTRTHTHHTYLSS